MVKSLGQEKVSEILEMLKNPAHSSNAKIAHDAGVSAASVSKLRKKLDEEINGPFFVQRLKNCSAPELVNVCRDPSLDPAPDTTKLLNDKTIPVISTQLLAKHRVHPLREFSTEAKQSLVQKYKGNGKDFHGFWICSPHESYNADAVDKLLEQFENDPMNMAHFTPIFEYTQDVKSVKCVSEGSVDESAEAAEPASKKPKKRKVGKRWKPSMNDRRMGDKLRKHLIWEEWIAVVLEKRKESQANVDRLQRELAVAQTKVTKLKFNHSSPESAESAAAAPGSPLDSPLSESPASKTSTVLSCLSTRQTNNFTKKIAAQIEEAHALCADLQRQLLAAIEAHAADVECDKQTQLVEDILGKNYEWIIANLPYAAMNVDRNITDRRLLSIILAMPEAGSQTIHADSLQRGCSLLMSARKRQYLIILLNGFRAMRSLERMLLRRAEALQYVRERISEEAPGDLSCWSDEAEHRIWNHLCCLQFKHEGIGAIQAVRVPIEAGETLVVDNRTLHGGSRGELTPGFRFHVYGYDRNISQRQGEERLRKDQDVTFDPLDVQLGFYPVCRWAQQSDPAVFRA
jgi:hypothetical protein